MIYAYTKELKPKKQFTINLSMEDALRCSGGNLFTDHPELDPNDYVIVERESEFSNPIYDIDTNTIEEATREQRILIHGLESELSEGEYVADGKILEVEKPLDMIAPAWDREKQYWYESETIDNLTAKRKDAMLKFAKCSRELKELKELEEIFENIEEQNIIEEQMKELKKEINKYAEQIEQLKQ